MHNLIQLAAHNTFVSEFPRANVTQVTLQLAPEPQRRLPSTENATIELPTDEFLSIVLFLGATCSNCISAPTLFHDVPEGDNVVDTESLALTDPSRRLTTSRAEMVDSLKDHIQNDVSGVMPSLTITTFIQIS